MLARGPAIVVRNSGLAPVGYICSISETPPIPERPQSEVDWELEQIRISRRKGWQSRSTRER